MHCKEQLRVLSLLRPHSHSHSAQLKADIDTLLTTTTMQSASALFLHSLNKEFSARAAKLSHYFCPLTLPFIPKWENLSLAAVQCIALLVPCTALLWFVVAFAATVAHSVSCAICCWNLLEFHVRCARQGQMLYVWTTTAIERECTLSRISLSSFLYCIWQC